MKVFVKIYPITGVCTVTQEVEVELHDGVLSELPERLQEQLGVDAIPVETLMFLRGGAALDVRTQVQLHDGDRLWVLPHISGG